MNFKEMWKEKELKRSVKNGLKEVVESVEDLNLAYKLSLEIYQQRIKVTPDEQTRILKG